MADQGLSVEDLVVHRGSRPVVHGVSIRILPGEVTCMLGANGAGKSSLVMAIAGELGVAHGSVHLDGKVLNGRSPSAIRRAGVSVIPEGHRVLSHLSVRDNLYAAGSHLSVAELNMEIEKAIELFPELKPRWSVPGSGLSGGQKQMVSLCQGLIARPRYLLVDELSLGLAPAVVHRLGDALTNIAATGISVMIIEQFTSLALSLAQKAYVMERGKIVFSGTSAALRENPGILHDAYLASAS